MALANRRPVAFPVNENATSSPSYKPRHLSLEKEYESNDHASTKIMPKNIREMTPEKSSTSSPQELDMEASPTSTVATSVSLGVPAPLSKPLKEPKEGKVKEKKEKKKEPRVPIATGISTTIPVTGERPKPEEDKSLEDSVLYAIFLILYEKDPEGKGMTVKQICDILVEKHPEMAKLSTKTSNLVSAKLNAYVKRVEKGEKDLIYALSREWADASPKRMVYVYRGLLAPDYYVHALAAIENHKNSLESSNESNDDSGRPIVSVEDKKRFLDNIHSDEHHLIVGSGGGNELRRRATAFDLGVNKHNFADIQLDLTPQISIPYSAAPVTASLGGGSTLVKPFVATSVKNSPVISDYDLEDYYDQFNDEDDEEDFSTFKASARSNKRSKSMSYISSKKARTLTIAAAAPRFSKESLTPSPSAAAAVAALQAAALEVLTPAGSVASGVEGSSGGLVSSEPPVAAKWLKAVRDGFLTQDIDAPEDISLAELDLLFP